MTTQRPAGRTWNDAIDAAVKKCVDRAESLKPNNNPATHVDHSVALMKSCMAEAIELLALEIRQMRES